MILEISIFYVIDEENGEKVVEELYYVFEI